MLRKSRDTKAATAMALQLKSSSRAGLLKKTMRSTSWTVQSSEVDDDEENERCTQVARVEISFVEHEEGVNESTQVRTKVDWYKVTP
jgi:hypothetical protein